jgi:uncharacterized membrane protein
MRTSQDRVADAITSFAGTMRFVYLPALWFAAWIALNEGLLGKTGTFDPYVDPQRKGTGPRPVPD